jgi:CRISPR-associated protein Csx17
VWTEGSLVDSLVTVALRRSVEATRTLAGGGAFAGSWGRLASLADVAAFLNGDVDDSKIAELALGFTWVDVAKGKPAETPHAHRDSNDPREPLPLAYAAIKPIFAPQPAKESDKRKPLKFTPTIAPLLAAGRIGEAVETATRRAQADNFATPFKGMKPVGVDPRRLLASLLFPISEWALQSCQNLAYPAGDKERPNENAA